MRTLKIATVIFIALIQFETLFAAESKNQGYGYTLESILIMALENDPWLKKSTFKEKSLLSQSKSQSRLPDPKASINLANVPVDDFSLNSQAMTQFKLGLSQSFARGDSLEIKGDINKLTAGLEPHLRENRKNQLIMMVSSLWLDVYKAQQSIALIANKQYLFEELREAAEISYTSALSKTSQQEMIRADLELAKLHDQVTVFSAQLDTSIRKLSEYVPLPQSYLSRYSNNNHNFVSQKLPIITLLTRDKTQQQHPLVKAIDTDIKASLKTVELQEQAYKPQFTVNGSYAFRENAPDGMERPDFFSVGVSFDLPLFTDSKQDQDVKSAVFMKEAKKEEKALLLNQLNSGLSTQLASLQRLKQRQSLYSQTLAPQVKQQGEASMIAYSNNEADFAELVRARIDEVNVQLTALEIAVEIEKTKVRANYYQASNAKELMALINTPTESLQTTAQTHQQINDSSGENHD
ncbi:TolC family protein [Kangiella marina]|uniref:TolC family protein n=1 Tax=Kangiella marina TaxID=1079178 RepID=A0ABP8IAS5_9GAMM